MRAWTLAFLLAVIALAPVFILAYYYARNNVPSEQPNGSINFDDRQCLDLGIEYEVKACKVIDGHRFALCLQGGKWIEGHLTAVSKEHAGAFAVQCMNSATPPVPTVILLRQLGNYWVVDLKLTLDGKRVSMKELLASKGLLL